MKKLHGVNVTGAELNEQVRTDADRIQMAGPGSLARGANIPSRLSRFAGGGYRPGMFGGYRPSWAGRFTPGMGGWKLGEMLKLPGSLGGKDLLTGALVGTVANRVVTWVVPGLVKTQSKLAVEAIGFAAGLVPYLVKQNATTVGIALPGLVFLAGAATEWAIGKTNLLGAKPQLQGAGPSTALAGQDAVLAARRKLAEVHNRIAQARQQAGVPRVAAQRVSA